jgi:hypothetical protein
MYRMKRILCRKSPQRKCLPALSVGALNRAKELSIQPKGDGSLSAMPVRGRPLAVAPARRDRVASLKACARDAEEVGAGEVLLRARSRVVAW